MSLLDVLVQQDALSQESALDIQQEASQENESLETVAVRRGVDPTKVLEAKGAHYNLPTRSIDAKTLRHEVLKYIPEDSVRHYQIVPLNVVDDVLEVGIVDPENIEARDAIQFIATKLDMPYKLFVISLADFSSLTENYETLSSEVSKALSELESEVASERDISALAEELGSAKKRRTDEDTLVEEAPVIKIVATMLRHAIEQGASDVHIEPMSEMIRIRFRVDGVLQTSLKLPSAVHSAIVARIKIVANMKIDEKRKPQDNRFSAHLFDRTIDFRVSTFPTYYGEKVEIRILDPEKGVFELDKLGLSKENVTKIRQAIKQPYGMILISGPTGSGKTSTLYAMLQEVDRERKNVLSLEDPVEYSIEGVSQSQVRPEIGYTFANGLRTTLRQDPDVIMVGEIRDAETAGLAVQAALTGHLVLSTIHTNDALGIVPRLLDMGIEPYLIPPTVIMGIAQRLVRRACPDALKKVPVNESMRMMIDREFDDLPEKYKKKVTIGDSVYEVEPTKECPTGTRGRVAVFELFEMTPKMEKTILMGSSDLTLRKIAREQGMLTMKENAIIKAVAGEIPFSEAGTLGTFVDVEIAEEEDTTVDATRQVNTDLDLESADGDIEDLTKE